MVFNRQLPTQRHFLAHTENISAQAVHPNRRFIATGQVDPKGKETVCVWHAIYRLDCFTTGCDALMH